MFNVPPVRSAACVHLEDGGGGSLLDCATQCVLVARPFTRVRLGRFQIDRVMDVFGVANDAIFGTDLDAEVAIDAAGRLHHMCPLACAETG